MPTADGQYHLDEFVGEVIGIAHLRRLHLDMPKRNGDPVVLIVGFDHPTDGWTTFQSLTEHKTMGFALADVRQQIKERWGR
jgi:hypothetical protein